MQRDWQTKVRQDIKARRKKARHVPFPMHEPRVSGMDPHPWSWTGTVLSRTRWDKTEQKTSQATGQGETSQAAGRDKTLQLQDKISQLFFKTSRQARQRRGGFRTFFFDSSYFVTFFLYQYQHSSHFSCGIYVYIYIGYRYIGTTGTTAVASLRNFDLNFV